jgi:hypothetical protein
MRLPGDDVRRGGDDHVFCLTIFSGFRARLSAVS